jgi:outer membrane lipoprotein-sorting protein
MLLVGRLFAVMFPVALVACAIPSNPSMSPTFTPCQSPPSEYRVEQVVSFPGQNEQRTTIIYRKGDRFRYETEIDGVMSVNLIWPAERVMYSFTDATTYGRKATLPSEIQPDPLIGPMAIRSSAQLVESGGTVGSRWDLYQQGDGDQAAAKVWFWKEYCFPLRMELESPEGVLIAEYRDIRFDPFPDDLFLPPSDITFLDQSAGDTQERIAPTEFTPDPRTDPFPTQYSYDQTDILPDGTLRTAKTWGKDGIFRQDQQVNDVRQGLILDTKNRIVYSYILSGPNPTGSKESIPAGAKLNDPLEPPRRALLEGTFLGEENIDGVLCDVYILDNLQEYGDTIVIKAWIRKNEPFPIRLETNTARGTVVTLYSNIVIGDIDDSLLQPPPEVMFSDVKPDVVPKS